MEKNCVFLFCALDVFRARVDFKMNVTDAPSTVNDMRNAMKKHVRHFFFFFSFGFIDKLIYDNLLFKDFIYLTQR